MLNDNTGGWGSRRPMIAGLCADLAQEFQLPVGLVRIVALVFMVLPTGFTYLALSVLANARQRRPAGRVGGAGGGSTYQAPFASSPRAGDWTMLRRRFAALEPRLGAIEAFVTSGDFELHRGFRRMDRT